MELMSRSNRKAKFVRNENGWADFFLTRIGLIIFAAILLLSAFEIYPMFKERESRLNLDTVASDIASKIEAVDSMTIPGYKYNYIFEENNRDIKIEISTEYIIAHTNLVSALWGEQELIHPEPVITHVFAPNSNWNNTSGFRKYISDMVGSGKNGDLSSPLDFNNEKPKVDAIFESTRKELARSPYTPDTDRPLFIEKVIMYYEDQKEIQKRDYVFVYQ